MREDAKGSHCRSCALGWLNLRERCFVFGFPLWVGCREGNDGGVRISEMGE